MDLSKQYSKGTECVWWAVTTTTLDMSILEHDAFLGTHGTRTLFSIECENGKNIRGYSAFDQEEEILLMPGFYFKVANVLKQSSDLHIIHLKEINPPFS
jgi:hypothetical protein